MVPGCRWTWWVWAALLVFLALSSPAWAADQQVTTVNNGGDEPYAYEPAEVAIQPGDTVTWVNPPGTPLSPSQDHPTACLQGESEGECPWGTFELPPGSEHSVTFPAEGTFAYACLIHPYMEGTVVVGDGTPDRSEPSPSAASSPAPSPRPSETAPEPSPTGPSPSASPTGDEDPTEDPSPGPPDATPSPTEAEAEAAADAAEERPSPGSATDTDGDAQDVEEQGDGPAPDDDLTAAVTEDESDGWSTGELVLAGLATLLVLGTAVGLGTVVIRRG